MILRAVQRRALSVLRRRSKWRVLLGRQRIELYAGFVPEADGYAKFTGLSLWRDDGRHICHDIRRRHGLPDNSVDVYEAEDVFEHIALKKIPAMIRDIHRILKPGGVFRLALPDYRCDVLAGRTMKNESGDFLFDPGGGGSWMRGRVRGRGHLWFPVYETVRELLENSPFRGSYTFLHYYDENGRPVLREIDYSIGPVKRTPDHDPRVRSPRRPLSIVVDAVKRAHSS